MPTAPGTVAASAARRRPRLPAPPWDTPAHLIARLTLARFILALISFSRDHAGMIHCRTLLGVLVLIGLLPQLGCTNSSSRNKPPAESGLIFGRATYPDRILLSSLAQFD